MHRDLKAANILLTADHRTAILSDFGNACREEDSVIHGGENHVGTLRYAAPEALYAFASFKSDVYSLGMVLWELIYCERAMRQFGGMELIIRRMQDASGTNLPTFGQQPIQIFLRAPRVQTAQLMAISVLDDYHYHYSRGAAPTHPSRMGRDRRPRQELLVRR